MKYMIQHSSSIEEKMEKTWMQILAIVIASASAITYGIIVAWTSPFIVKLTTDKINFDITPDQASYLTYISPATMVVACTLFSILSDRIGRKHTLMLITIPHCCFWISTVVSNSIYVFYFSRIFGGIGDGCLLVTLPVYIAEVSIPRIRGVWGNLVAVYSYLGIFLINIIGSQFSIEVTAYICLPLPVIYVCLMYFLPESPYWYIMQGRDDDAKNSLRRLRGIENVDHIFNQLKEDINKQMTEKGSWKDLITVPANRRGLGAGIFLRVSQLFGGVGVFISFTQYIFEDLDIAVPSDILTIIFSGITVGILTFSGYVIEKFGKKKALIVTNFLNGIIFTLQAIYFYLDSEAPDLNVSSLKWFPIVGMVLYAILASFGSMPIPNIMLGELFSTSIKAKAISVLIVVFGLVFCASNIIFYQLHIVCGMSGPFLFFGVVNLFSVILDFHILPETAGKTLEEIQMILSQKKGSVMKGK